MTTAEWVLIAMFSGIALFFVLGKNSPIYPVHSFQLGIIALIGISLVMFVPGLFPFKWKQVQDKTMWGTFLLLGGAITLTGAMTKSGLAAWLADHIHALVTGHSWWMVLLIMMVGTHIMRIGMLSNVAAIAMLAPILFEPRQAARPASGRLHHARGRYRHLRLPAADADHRRRHRVRHRYVQHHGLLQGRVGLRPDRDRLRHRGDGAVVRHPRHAGLESGRPLAVLSRRRSAPSRLREGALLPLVRYNEVAP